MFLCQHHKSTPFLVFVGSLYKSKKSVDFFIYPSPDTLFETVSERFISSFINHYQNSAYFVEPLFQVKVGGREGITIGIIDKQGNGASLEDAKRICNESLRSIRKGNRLNTINRE